MIGSDKAQRWSPGRDVAWALTLKAALLLLLYLACFGPSHRVAMTPARVAAVLTLAASPR
jgi:hypothetical protein